MSSPRPLSDRWLASYPYLIVADDDKDKIKEYINSKIVKSKKSTKPFNFYMFLATLHSNYPETVEALILKIPEWGTWKELFVLLLACSRCSNSTLIQFIYNFVKEQLFKDQKELQVYNKNTKRNKKNTNSGFRFSNVSMLAKWIPKEQKSFDKKLNFVSTICKIMYPTIENQRAKRWYRKLVTGLNSHLDTTEIKLCSKKFNEIDFEHVPNSCLKKNMKTFLANEDSRKNLEIFTFKQYLKLDMNHLINLLLFKEPTELQKTVINNVWNTNKDQFQTYLKEVTGVLIWKPELLIVLDLTKTMFDNKQTATAVGVALLASGYSKSTSCIVVNGFIPTVLNLNSLTLLEKIDRITEESSSYDKIDLDKIVETATNKNFDVKNILIITDKLNNSSTSSNNKVDKFDLLHKDNSIKVTSWSLNKFYSKDEEKKDSARMIVVKKNLLTVSQTVDELCELEVVHWTHHVGDVFVVFFTLIVLLSVYLHFI